MRWACLDHKPKLASRRRSVASVASNQASPSLRCLDLRSRILGIYFLFGKASTGPPSRIELDQNSIRKNAGLRPSKNLSLPVPRESTCRVGLDRGSRPRRLGSWIVNLNGCNGSACPSSFQKAISSCDRVHCLRQACFPHHDQTFAGSPESLFSILSNRPSLLPCVCPPPALHILSSHLTCPSRPPYRSLKRP